MKRHLIALLSAFICVHLRFRVSSILMLALLGAPSAHALKSDADQPINIRARNVEANEKTGVSVYRGNVVMTQGSLRLEADRLEVTLRERQTELIRASGKPLRLLTRTDAGEEIRAAAARAEYRGKSRRIDLFGDVELRRDGDVFTGAVLRYLLDDETFTADGGDGGQVSVTIQPAKKDVGR
jgi:lipopolysaccharide export system protein LptA